MSIDGPKEIHDTYRKIKDNKGSFEMVKFTIKLLRSNEIPLHVIVVVHNKSIGKAKEIYEFLRNENIDCFDFLPCVRLSNSMNKKSEAYVDPNEFGDFLIEIFDCWLKEGNPLVFIRTFESIIRGLQGKNPQLCIYSGNCKFMVVDVNGDVYYPCDCFVGHERFKVGNIVEEELGGILNSPKIQQIDILINSVRNSSKCLNCSWWSICKNGCPAHIFYFYGDFNHKTPFCLARRKIFHHVSEAIRKHQEVYCGTLNK